MILAERGPRVLIKTSQSIWGDYFLIRVYASQTNRTYNGTRFFRKKQWSSSTYMEYLEYFQPLYINV